VIAMMQ